jgi:hypothetical protein
MAEIYLNYDICHIIFDIIYDEIINFILDENSLKKISEEHQYQTLKRYFPMMPICQNDEININYIDEFIRFLIKISPAGFIFSCNTFYTHFKKYNKVFKKNKLLNIKIPNQTSCSNDILIANINLKYLFLPAKIISIRKNKKIFSCIVSIVKWPDCQNLKPINTIMRITFPLEWWQKDNIFNEKKQNIFQKILTKMDNYNVFNIKNILKFFKKEDHRKFEMIEILEYLSDDIIKITLFYKNFQEIFNFNKINNKSDSSNETLPPMKSESKYYFTFINYELYKKGVLESNKNTSGEVAKYYLRDILLIFRRFLRKKIFLYLYNNFEIIKILYEYFNLTSEIKSY